MNLKYMKVSLFEISYKNKLTFPRHSNLLRCTCIQYEFMLCKSTCIWPLGWWWQWQGLDITLSWLPDPWNWNCHTLWPQPPDKQVICTPAARHHQHHHCPSVRWIVMSGAGHITNTISDISQRKYALPREGLILEVIYGHIILLVTHKALLSAECILLKWKVICTPATWWCITAQHTVYHPCFKDLDTSAESLTEVDLPQAFFIVGFNTQSFRYWHSFIFVVLIKNVISKSNSNQIGLN